MYEKVKLANETDVVHPKLFAIVIYNDDYTTMDFVVEVIVKVFHKSTDEATLIMLNVHEEGRCVVDIFTFDIAVTKKAQVDSLAAQREFPLKVSIERVI